MVNKMLKSNFDETKSTVKASFRKVVQVKDYESETVDLQTEIEFDRVLTVMERVFIASILKNSLEYSAMISLYNRNYVTAPQLNERIGCIKADIDMLMDKAKKLGINIDDIWSEAVIDYNMNKVEE